MNGLSYLERLLDGVEVEWSNLGSVCDIYTGGEAPRNHIKGDTPTSDYQYPIYGNGAGIYGYADNYRIGQDAVTISSIGANTGTIYFRKAFFTPIVRLKVVIPKHSWLLSKYIFHYLSSKTINSKSSSIPNMNASDVKKLGIPIPCPDNPEKSLVIQSEIVRILDAFTALTAELTAELTMREKQYNYYRDQLLSFKEGNIEWKTLGDIGDVRMCKRILKNETQPEGDVPFYKIGTFGKKANAFISEDVFEAYKKKYSFPKKGDVLISASGTIGRTVIYDGEPAYFQDSNIVWLENDESIVTNKYLWHFYKIAKWAVSEGGTIDRLYNDNIRKTKIIVPYPSDSSKSLAEQNRVVAILDKFDALTCSISEGLPREIELRQKQYEYYRDLLFSFPKPETASN
ncbi:restriction endonuclease subunit S [Edwardsiella tarda]